MKNYRIIAVAAVTSVSLLGAAAPVSAHNWGESERSGSWNRCADERRAVRRVFRHADLNDMWSQQHVQAAVNDLNDAECMPKHDIVDTLARSGQFDTLITAVQAAGLEDTLRSGEYTVFAPTDVAFAALPAGTLDAVLKDPALLTAILTYHVVPGSVPAATAMTLTSAPTVNGQSATVSQRDGGLYIDDSRVIVADIMAENGIVHAIDAVLMPAK